MFVVVLRVFLEFLRVLGIPLGKLFYRNVNCA